MSQRHALNADAGARAAAQRRGEQAPSPPPATLQWCPREALRGRPHRPRRAPRDVRSRGAPEATPAPPAPTPPGQTATRPEAPLCAPRSSPTRRCRGGGSSLEFYAQLSEAARDAACDRSLRDVERSADRRVALVAREEAVEDLRAVLRKVGERGADGQSLLEAVELVVGSRLDALELGDVEDRLARRGAQPVDRYAPRQLGEPRPDRAVVAQARELLVGACEDLLEGVLRRMCREGEPAREDRVHVAGEALDEQRPGVVVACSAASDELGVGWHDRHPLRTIRA